MKKHHCLAKRLKREIVEELVKSSIQEEDSIKKFEDSMYEESRGTINENQEKFSENIEEIHRFDTKQEEGKCYLQQNQNVTDVQESILEFPITDNLKVDNPQSSCEKYKEELFARGLKCEMVQLLAIKYQGKSLVMVGGEETRWRPKTRAKNKLRLNMKSF